MKLSESRAMLLCKPRTRLVETLRPLSVPSAGQVRIGVQACGVCRTDLHVIDGELPQAVYPIVPGHEVIGEVDGVGEGVRTLAPGDRVGVPWLAWTCGGCRYCRCGHENL